MAIQLILYFVVNVLNFIISMVAKKETIFIVGPVEQVSI